MLQNAAQMLYIFLAYLEKLIVSYTFATHQHQFLPKALKDNNDTTLQTHYSKFEPWRFEAEHATSRSRRLPTILNH